ncbi:MAG: CBS domain-containing protein [Nitrososphaeraceae archaeon]|nr:CBS domain-containing protein [Nitrososphaeraceae archaeon]
MTDNYNKLTVESIMTSVPLETADISDNIYNICQKMTQKNVGCIIITENKVPVGIITERDIVRKVVCENKDVKNTTTSEIMSHPLITISPEFFLDQTARIMTKYRIRRVPVVLDNILHGIITAGDIGKKMCERGSRDPVLMAMSRYSLIENL